VKTYRVAALSFVLLLAASSASRHETESERRRSRVATADALSCAVVDGPSIADRQSTERQPIWKRFAGERLVRTELVFGLARAGGEVTEAEFKQFLEQCVTPQFPDGFTVLPGFGRFRGADGMTIEERSMLLILLYPDDVRRENSKKIEEIRDAYKEVFGQESVLRSDRCCEQVRF
jgi:Protein of unknown function (DUF3574)